MVSWSAPANDGGSTITGYRLQASNTGASGWSNLVQNTTDTSYEHTGLSAGTTRHYRVYATNGIGTSQPSAVVSDRTQPGATSCTPNPGDYWCGVVTVALYTVGGLDFANGFVDASVTTNPSDTGALSDETFSVGPNNYTIDTAVTGLEGLVGRLEFGLTSTLAIPVVGRSALRSKGVRTVPGAFVAGSPGHIDLDCELRACAGLGVAPVFGQCGTEVVKLSGLTP